MSFIRRRRYRMCIEKESMGMENARDYVTSIWKADTNTWKIHPDREKESHIVTKIRLEGISFACDMMIETYIEQKLLTGSPSDILQHCDSDYTLPLHYCNCIFNERLFRSLEKITTKYSRQRWDYWFCYSERHSGVLHWHLLTETDLVLCVIWRKRF